MNDHAADFTEQCRQLSQGGEIVIEHNGCIIRIVSMAGYYTALTRLMAAPLPLSDFFYQWQERLQDDEHFLLTREGIIHVLYLKEINLTSLFNRIRQTVSHLDVVS